MSRAGPARPVGVGWPAERLCSPTPGRPCRATWDEGVGHCHLVPQNTPDRSDGGAGSADDRSGRDGGGYGRGRRPWLMRLELQDRDRRKRSDPLDCSRAPGRRRAGQDPSYPAPPRRGSLHSWPVLAHGIDVDGPEERGLTLLTGPFDAPLGPHVIPLRSDRTLPRAARTGSLAAGSRGLCQQRFRFAQEALSLGDSRRARIPHPLA